MGPLASSVKENAKQWIGSLGKILRDSAKETLFKLRDELDVSYSDTIKCLFLLFSNNLAVILDLLTLQDKHNIYCTYIVNK
jgi:hypothetical protein